MNKKAYSALLHDNTEGVWLHYTAPVEIVSVMALGDVPAALRHVENRVGIGGLHAVGFVSYEAGPAFDPALVTQASGDFPLLWFGLYREPETVSAPYKNKWSDVLDVHWEPEISQKKHADTLAIIKDEIAEGNTYQVNFTHRLLAQFDGDPFALFAMMQTAQPSGYGAFIDTGRFVICSASPELFLSLDGKQIISRPMKGTASRGLWTKDDQARAHALARSTKERAENLMIADMVRNDLGKIANFGSVRTTELFKVEHYPTVWQMTSTVEAETDATVAEIFTACFPPASITGAPKSSTMRLIAGLECSPRNIYTGAIGMIQPDKKAQFNVAIRTALIDREQRTAEYGIGGGIVWDSQPKNEWQECQTKARILSRPVPDFCLIETMLWEPEKGYTLLERHMNRLAQSAEYFDFVFAEKDVLRQLDESAGSLSLHRQKVRLLLDRDGATSLESTPLIDVGKRTLNVGLAQRAVNTQDRFLYHKTTNREVYENVRAAYPGFDDIILTNERGEVTESCIANVVIEIGGTRYTPQLCCGLLPGTQREELLANGEITERIITVEDLQNSEAIYLINSVRGWTRVKVVFEV